MPDITATPADDFQRAAAAAEADNVSQWGQLQAGEQSTAIYEQLRRLDAARANALHFRAGPRDGSQGKPERLRRRAAAFE